jgi:1,4-alpha-glucan branching enzyme
LPFTEFSSEYSLGYNSMLPYAVEKDYGTPYDVKDLINACHKKGIAVFLDVIYNHIDVKGDAETPKPYSLAVYDGWRTPQKPDGIYFYGGDEINTPWGSPIPD